MQAVGDGTYTVGVRAANLGDKTKALDEAVRAAGKHCHAQGQKLQMIPNSGGDDLQFRCTGPVQPTVGQPATGQATY